MYEISFADNGTFKFYFQKNHVVIVDEELDGIDIDGIGRNLVDLPNLS